MDQLLSRLEERTKRNKSPEVGDDKKVAEAKEMILQVLNETLSSDDKSLKDTGNNI